MDVGDVIRWERTFTTEDVVRFSKVSLDHGTHHMEPDDKGRLLVHGLLTATLPTRVGGALDYLAQEMVYRFLRPVFTGDTVVCEVEITELTDHPRGTRMSAVVRCTNGDKKLVLEGSTYGVILKPLSAVKQSSPDV